MRTHTADELYEQAQLLPRAERLRLVARIAQALIGARPADADADARATSAARAPGRVVMARKIRLDEDDGSFDQEFWARVGSAGRFEAAWEAVRDLVRWGKLDERQLRLQRSVVRTYRRGDAVPDGGRLRGDSSR